MASLSMRQFLMFALVVCLIWCVMTLIINDVVSGLFITQGTGNDHLLGHLFYSWQIPRFAYFNNQFLLHVLSLAYAPIHKRSIVSPGFFFPAIRGLERPALLPISVLFNEELLVRHGIHSFLSNVSLEEIQHPPTNRKDLLLAHGLVQARKLQNLPQKVIIVSNETDEFWTRQYFPFVIKAFIFSLASDVQNAMDNFHYVGPIGHCIDRALGSQPGLRSAIGLHIRTWAKDVSISPECTTINGRNPLRFIYKCDLESNITQNDVEMVEWNIDRMAESAGGQPIFIATDNAKSPLITGLISKYGDRITFYTKEMLSKCIDEYFNNIPDSIQGLPKPVRQVAEFYSSLIDKELKSDQQVIDMVKNFYLQVGFPLVQSDLLTHTKAFVGSFFSTFSQVVWLRRRGRNSRFIQTKQQNLLLLFLQILAVMIILSAVVLLLQAYRQRRRRICCAGRCRIKPLFNF